MITTEHTGELQETSKVSWRTGEEIKKPDVILAYTENVGLIDKSDAQISNQECMGKSVKWYKKLFFHLVDLTLLQAYNTYLTHTGKRMMFQTFSYNVVYQLLEKSVHYQQQDQAVALQRIPQIDCWQQILSSIITSNNFQEKLTGECGKGYAGCATIQLEGTL